MKNECWKCKKDVGAAYQFVEYRESEIVPTADGGLYARVHLRFCEPWCLVSWLASEKKDKEPIVEEPF